MHQFRPHRLLIGWLVASSVWLASGGLARADDPPAEPQRRGLASDAGGEGEGADAPDGSRGRRETRKRLIRIGIGIDLQTGIGNGAGRLTVGANGVFEWNELRIYAEGGLLTGAEPASGPDSGFYLDGWWAGTGVGYKLTLAPPDLFGLYAEAGIAFQRIGNCLAGCAGPRHRSSVGFDTELGAFVHNGASQIHLAATVSSSTRLGPTVGGVLRWEYKVYGFAR